MTQPIVQWLIVALGVFVGAVGMRVMMFFRDYTKRGPTYQQGWTEGTRRAERRAEVLADRQRWRDEHPGRLVIDAEPERERLYGQ